MSKDVKKVGTQWEFVSTRIEKRPLGTDEPEPHHLVIGNFGGKEKGKSYDVTKKSDIDDKILSVAKPEVDTTFDRSSMGEVLSTEVPEGDGAVKLLFEKMADFSRSGLRDQLEAGDEAMKELLGTIKRLQALQKRIQIPTIRKEIDKLISNAGPNFANLEEFLEVFDQLSEENAEGVNAIRGRIERDLED